MASNTDTLSQTGTSQPERSRRSVAAWAGVVAALVAVAGLAFAAVAAGDDPAVRNTPTSGDVQGMDDHYLPGSHNVPR